MLQIVDSKGLTALTPLWDGPGIALISPRKGYGIAPVNSVDRKNLMEEQEFKDLEEMKAAVQAKKISTYDYMVAVLRYTESDLLHSGYRNKTIAQALELILNASKKDIDKLTKAYLTQYPDGKNGR